MRRREFITLPGSATATWPVAARAQQPIRRVGVLTLASSKDEDGVLAAFVDGLHNLGLFEGKNLTIDYRYSDGDVKRLMPLAQEPIARRPDVLIGAEPSPAKVLKSVAPTLPIVCPELTDAQLSDLVASYARPRGTVTGLATDVEGLTGKLIVAAWVIEALHESDVDRRTYAEEHARNGSGVLFCRYSPHGCPGDEHVNVRHQRTHGLAHRLGLGEATGNDEVASWKIKHPKERGPREVFHDPVDLKHLLRAARNAGETKSEQSAWERRRSR